MASLCLMPSAILTKLRSIFLQATDKDTQWHSLRVRSQGMPLVRSLQVGYVSVAYRACQATFSPSSSLLIHTVMFQLGYKCPVGVCWKPCWNEGWTFTVLPLCACAAMLSQKVIRLGQAWHTVLAALSNHLSSFFRNGSHGLAPLLSQRSSTCWLAHSSLNHPSCISLALWTSG